MTEQKSECRRDAENRAEWFMSRGTHTQLADVLEQRTQLLEQRIAMTAQIAALESKLEQAQKELIEAAGYLTRLLRSVYPEIHILDTLPGICTQIDNGLAVALTLERSKVEKLCGKVGALINHLEWMNCITREEQPIVDEIRELILPPSGGDMEA